MVSDEDAVVETWPTGPVADGLEIWVEVVQKSRSCRSRGRVEVDEA